MENQIYYVPSSGILGIRTNVSEFKWSYGITMPPAGQRDYDNCIVKLTLHIVPSAFYSSRDEDRFGKYHYFTGRQGRDELFYQRPFLFNSQLQLRARGLVAGQPEILANRTYFRFVKHRFMNLHSVAYIMTDLASALLLKRDYSPLHCSAFRSGPATVVVLAPPNTGKTLSTMMACLQYDADFIAEDLAITDGEMIYSVPWTSTFRYYNTISQNPRSRIANRLASMFPPLELIGTRKADTIDKYVEPNRILHRSRVTHVVILERGEEGIDDLTVGEAHRKIVNLNQYEFKYDKAPLLIAYEFFNPSLDLRESMEAERRILRSLVEHADSRLIVRSHDPLHYTELILSAIT